MIDPRDFERVVDPLIHPYKSQASPIPLAGDVGSYESTNSCRICERHRGEIKD